MMVLTVDFLLPSYLLTLEMWVERWYRPWQEASGASVVALLATALVIHVALVYQRRKQLPPGPWPWPVVGNLQVLRGQPHKNLQKLAAKYGGLMYLQLGEKPCLVVSTAAAAKDFFKTHDAAFASRPRTLADEVLTARTYRTMPAAPYGDYWRQLRRVCGTHLFSPTVHASHQATRQGEIRTMVKVLVEDHAWTGATIDLFHWLTGVTANTLTMMLTNNRFFDIRDKNQEKRDYDATLKRIFEAHGTLILSDHIPYLRFITRLQGWEPYLEELRGRARSMIWKIIEVEKHKERVTDVPDFVDVLLRTPLDDGEPLADADIATLLLSFLNAGTDTTAITVEWAMAELMANPDVRAQAQAELDRVVGQERLVEERDISNLPLLRAIIQETYRLHPSTPLALRHESHEPRVVSGCAFPAHTHLILNIYAIHRDPNEYLDADEFKPSRFLGRRPDDDYDSSFRLIPFGVGRRMCPGSNLGNTMVSMLLATLLQSFHWSLPLGETLDMAESFSSIVTCKLKPLRLVAAPRPSAALY